MQRFPAHKNLPLRRPKLITIAEGRLASHVWLGKTLGGTGTDEALLAHYAETLSAHILARRLQDKTMLAVEKGAPNGFSGRGGRLVRGHPRGLAEVQTGPLVQDVASKFAHSFGNSDTER